MPANAEGPVPLVLHLLITHERFGSSSDPSINGRLHYPRDLDGSLNESPTDKTDNSRINTVQTIIIVPLKLSPL